MWWEVNTFGGMLKTYEIQLDANKLVSYNLSLAQVIEAVEQKQLGNGAGLT